MGQKKETADNRTEVRMARLARDLLNENASDLPSHITEKLAKARNLALAHRQLEKKWAWQREFAFSMPGMPSAHDLGGKIWGAFGALPLLALILGLFLIVNWQKDERIRDIAEVDSALLIDVVPPEAYHDDGFIRFLMTDGKDLDASSNDKEGV
jgi:hypothetical protein